MNPKADPRTLPLPSLLQLLRAPDGCAWNRAQTLSTLAEFLREESYELLDAMADVDARPPGKNLAPTDRVVRKLREELGDVLLQLVFQTEIARENGWFSWTEVEAGIVDKMVRRHPHVFGTEKATSPTEVARLWEQVKASERALKELDAANPESALDGVSTHLPALARGQKVGQKAAANCFDWPNLEEVWRKVEEETRELKEALAERQAMPEAKSAQAAVEHELGDLLFTLCNVARFVNIDAETALHSGVSRFLRRFGGLENLLQAKNLRLSELSLSDAESLWQEAKRLTDPK